MLFLPFLYRFADFGSVVVAPGLHDVGQQVRQAHLDEQVDDGGQGAV